VGGGVGSIYFGCCWGEGVGDHDLGSRVVEHVW